MELIAKFIAYFLVGTTILSFVIAVAARIKTKNREFNDLIWYWVTLFVSFVAVGALSANDNQIAISFFFSSPPALLLTKILSETRGLKINWRAIIISQLLGMAVSSFLLLKLDAGFTLSLIPFILTISYPWILPIYDTLYLRRSESNWIEKGIAIILSSGILSHFSFAIYRLDESAIIWGWAQAIGHYQSISIFLPLLMNHRREMNERRKLEMAIEKISGSRPVEDYKEIDELYQSLEHQITKKETYSAKLARTNQKLKEEKELNEILFQAISHDLSNPIMATGSYINMIRSGKVAPSNLDNILEKMQQNIQRGSNMIQRLRRTIVTKSEIDLINIGPVDLKLALTRAEVVFENALKEKNLEIRIYCSENLQVLAEENTLVEHVFSNLISNAIKFSFDGGRIDIFAEQTEEKVRIEFRDYGVGLQPKNESGRFITTKGTNGEAGTGFGLVILGYFLRKFDATMETIYQSHYGRPGTSFVLYLKTYGHKVASPFSKDVSFNSSLPKS